MSKQYYKRVRVLQKGSYIDELKLKFNSVMKYPKIPYASANSHYERLYD